MGGKERETGHCARCPLGSHQGNSGCSGRHLPQVWAPIHEVKDLGWVEELLEFAQKLDALVVPTLGVDKGQERTGAGRGAGGFPETCSEPKNVSPGSHSPQTLQESRVWTLHLCQAQSVGCWGRRGSNGDVQGMVRGRGKRKHCAFKEMIWGKKCAQGREGLTAGPEPAPMPQAHLGHPSPLAGICRLLPLADPAMLQQGLHQPSLPQAPAPQPLPSESCGLQPGAPAPPPQQEHGGNIPTAHPLLAWPPLHLHSQPSRAEQISNTKPWELLSQSVGCSGKARCQPYSYAGAGQHGRTRGDEGLAKLLPVGWATVTARDVWAAGEGEGRDAARDQPPAAETLELSSCVMVTLTASQ